jgi:glycosyltransferase involved in cell wall biosynthesis
MIPKVSILIPVYNVSAYIEKCAYSLFNQTFADIEYIFVDDATPDDSMEKLSKVIEEYPQRKNQIKIIHHSSNKGSAAARNTAIDASTGEFIAMIDSDDFIDSEMIETLYQKALDENADIVVSDIILEFVDRSVVITEYISKNINDHFPDMVRNDRLHAFSCDKLVSRSLYTRADCRVPDGLNYLEDRHIMTRIFYFAKKIVKIDQAFYHYIQYNDNAITKTKNRMHFENVLLFWSLLDSFLKEKNEFEKYKQITELSKVENKVRLMIDTHSSILRKEFAKMFYEEESNCLSKFRKGEKLMLLLVRYKFFGLAQLFHNMLLIKHKKQLLKSV